LADQFTQSDEGSLTIATTHTQARYILPPIVSAFKKQFPKVHLVIHQARPAEIVQLLNDGQADIGIATEAVSEAVQLAHFAFYDWRHIVVVPVGHPLEHKTNLSLAELSEYPLVTYYPGITGRQRIDETFTAEGLVPDIVISALDSDVIKTYVELGLGVGILASMSFNPQRDQGLRLVEVADLFVPNTAHIAVRYGHYLRGYAYRFIELCSKRLSEAVVREALESNIDE